MNEEILVVGLGTIFGLFTGVVLTMFCFVRNICQRFFQIESRQISLERDVQELKNSLTEQEVQFFN